MFDENQSQLSIKFYDACRRFNDRQRHGSIYANADLFLLCFSVTNPHSLDKIEKYWIFDIRKQNKTTPVILLGLKSDLREENLLDNQKPSTPIFESVSVSKAEEMKEKINAADYIECSSLQQLKIKEVIKSCIKVVGDHRKKMQQIAKNKCLVA